MRFVFSLLLLVIADTCLAAPHVLVTIKPLYALTQGVMAGIGTPELLLRGNATPHSYALRPSDAHHLAEADLIVWVGPELENFLLKPLRNLAKDARILTLLQQDQLLRLPQRSGGLWSRGHDHRHGATFNPHVWLDPLNAQKIVQLIAAELITLDPQHSAGYRVNADRLTEKLAALNKKLAADLAELQGVPYLVFHDAYPYFEKRYRLSAVGSVAISPERLPGAHRLAEIRQKIENTHAVCIFSEPQFQPQLVEALQAATGIKTGILDPLGADLPDSSSSYFQLLNNLADNLNHCLAPNSPR